MDSIVKTRSFDCLKKLSSKRASGRLIHIRKILIEVHTTILLLDKLDKLQPELLLELIEVKKKLYIEARKLEYVIEFRGRNSELNIVDLERYIYCLSNITNPFLRIPYEIRYKSKYYELIKELIKCGN